MRKLIINSPLKIKKAIPKLKKKIKVEIDIKKNNVIIEGTEFNEFTVEKMIQALDFGFEVEDVLGLLNDDCNIEYINIKDHTHRKNLSEIRSRLIGAEGKAKRTLETLTGAAVVVHGNCVGIISDAEHMPHIIQGVISLIQGAKHSNVFSYIERQNSNLKKIDTEELDLRHPEKDLKNLD
jgi:ribosomal RNA assembly protein